MGPPNSPNREPIPSVWFVFCLSQVYSRRRGIRVLDRPCWRPIFSPASVWRPKLRGRAQNGEASGYYTEASLKELKSNGPVQFQMTDPTVRVSRFGPQFAAGRRHLLAPYFFQSYNEHLIFRLDKVHRRALFLDTTISKSISGVS